MLRSKASSCVALFLALWLIGQGDSHAQTAVRFGTWPSYGKNAGFYLGMERGYFAAHGIDLKIVNTFQNTLLLLETGQAEVSQVFLSDALEFIKQGRQLRILAVRDAKCPLATVSLGSSDIHTPSDYAGKRWAMSPGAFPEGKVFAALKRQYGLDTDSVSLVHVEFPARLASLLRHDADFASAWWGSGYPAMLVAARKAGATLAIQRWSDSGFDCYGEVLVVRKQWFDLNREMAREFLRAIRASYGASLSDPQAAISATQRLASLPNDQREILDIALAQSNELLKDTNTARTGLFSIDREKLRKNVSMMGYSLPLEAIVAMEN